METIKYSIFRYTPSFITGENIVIGLLILSETGTRFIHTRKYRRITEFDDEIDTNYLKCLFTDLEKELTSTLINSVDDVLQKMKHYVNEFSFEPFIEISMFDSFENEVKQLEKVYLKYDYCKTERLDKSEEFKLVDQIFNANGVDFKKNSRVSGKYDEAINYDITFGNYGIKFFSFNGKNLSKLLNTAKAWAWNADFDSRQAIFIYSFDETTYSNEKKMFDIIINIFKSSKAKVFELNDGIDFLSSELRNLRK